MKTTPRYPFLREPFRSAVVASLVPCEWCQGTGEHRDLEDGYPTPLRDCPKCAGRGLVMADAEVSRADLPDAAAEPCPDCGADPMVHAIDCDRMARYYE